VALVETLNAEHSPPERFGNPPDCEPPADLDWDTWLGPARKVPYNPARVAGHYFFWDYGGGWQSDWAVHHHDIVHWAMGADAPIAVAASGGKYFLTDCTEMPDTLEACFEYPGFLSVYRLTWSNARPREGLNYGNIFYGSQGTLVLNRSGWRVFADNETRPSLERPGAAGDVAHQRNFLDCVRTRSQPNADIETGHRSSIPGEIANIAFRLGRRLVWDGARETFPADHEARAMLLREYRAPWTLPVFRPEGSL
jgi:predicted dehydrogenase